MQPAFKTPTSLPDITAQNLHGHSSVLQWVGMEKIAIPITTLVSDYETASVVAYADCYVSLDNAAAKGIHMSRLYLQLNEYLAAGPVTPEKLKQLLAGILKSHEGLSESARVRLSYDLPVKKSALLSNNSGFQAYPVVLNTSLIKGECVNELELTIPYSSTCPCSASLARQLLSQSIEESFSGDTINKAQLREWLESEKGSVATPHSQRSYAYLKLMLEPGYDIDLFPLIAQLEQAIGTPVQTAVKREDEQAFARLNGSNLMFCEDAARRLKQALESISFIQGYWFKVEHQESLHAHNAVVIDQKHYEKKQA